jgi:hypothetical protein
MNAIKLYGFFTHVDKYNRLMFKYISDLDDSGNAITKDEIKNTKIVKIPVGEYVCYDKLVRCCDTNQNLQGDALIEKQLKDIKPAKKSSNTLDDILESVANNEEIPPTIAVPYTTQGFAVVLNQKHIPKDISMLIALECTIFVNVSRYQLVSKLEHNKGEKVHGTRLILQSIRPGLR